MKYYLILAIVALSLLSCTPPQDQAPVIHEVICPAEVPAFFDTALMIRASDPVDGTLQFKWYSENGTIRGQGDSVTWNAPPKYGTYKIDVKAINVSGNESIRQSTIEVVPFNQTVIDPDPEINLALPLLGSGTVSKQSLVRPMTTAEINCDAPLSDIKQYHYMWSCNGGKLLGTGIKDSTASKIGWVSPGVPGYYTVTVKVTDNWGNAILGSVYCQVKNPACCEAQDSGEIFQWKD